MGYDFSIQYKKGRDNVVANALSRVMEGEEQGGGMLVMISFPTPNWLEELKIAYDSDVDLSRIKGELMNGQPSLEAYKMQ